MEERKDKSDDVNPLNVGVGAENQNKELLEQENKQKEKRHLVFSLFILCIVSVIFWFNILKPLGEFLTGQGSHSRGSQIDASLYTDMTYPCPKNPKEKKEQILAHMKRKYGVEFEFFEQYPEDSVLMYKRTFYVNPIGKRDDIIAVECRCDKEERRFFVDSYFCLLIKDRYTQYIRDLLDGFYSEYFLNIDWVYEYDTFPDRFRGDMPISEIYKPRDFYYWTRIDICIPQKMLHHKSIKDNAWMIAEKFLEHNIHCQMYLYTVKEEKYAEFKEKEGNIFPPEEDSDYYVKRDNLYKEFFIREENMIKSHYCVWISPDDKSELEITNGYENK